ncbi:hypothetical protein HPB52_004833 [Rhipicephalus sanguineus]|uniref:Uncharacterized protein n=1 Tax=Rhipicephalus sanguineus TaxID=34632 RepID=A0A9D4PQZ2_RHISA|nr:hypothetical protein HPB52_004833 [Rhipicephalus sanguineus]
MHSNGCPPHESSRRTECTSALKVSPSWRAMSDSCASNPRVKQPQRLGKIVPQLFNTMCCQRQVCDRNQLSSRRWPLFVAAGQGTVLVHRNIPFYCGHHRPCERFHCKFFRRPVHSGPGLPTTQGKSCGHPSTNCYCRRRTTLGAPTTTPVDPTAQQRYPLRTNSDAARGNSDN